MLKLVRWKFQQNKDFAKLLLETGDAVLIEGNTWHDNTWGSCYCEKCQHIDGQNLLGNILMKVRSELHRLTYLKFVPQGEQLHNPM